VSSPADEALQRARTHLRNFTLEGLEAARALLEAARHASGLTAATPDSIVDQLQEQLEELIAALRNNASFVVPRALAEPLGAAIDIEIKRWEERSQTDPDARLVLRAFLGMRELLWEVSARSEGVSKSVAPRPKTAKRSGARPDQPRVQRFKIED